MNFHSACRLSNAADREMERPKIKTFKNFEQTAAE
jgi:hypothetical protein